MNNQEIITTICKMDIEKLNYLFNKCEDYPKPKKENLLKEFSLIFNQLKKTDSCLDLVEGKCCATCDDCENADKSGWSFLAKNSKKYFSLIFDNNKSGELKNIYTCLYFGVVNQSIQEDIENNYELIYVSEGSLKSENFLKPF